MFGPSLAQVIGATTLLSAADRLPPAGRHDRQLRWSSRLGTAALAVPGLPVWAAFAIVAALGLVASLGGGVSLRAAQRDPAPGRTCSAARC